MERLQFMGSTLFIPIFLVSVGVLLEPKVMIDPKTLGDRAGVHGRRAGRQGAGGGHRGADLPLHLARGRRDVGPVGLAGGGHAGHHAGRRQAGPLRHADHQRRAGRHPGLAGRDAGAGELLRQAGHRGRPRRPRRSGRSCWCRCGATRRARRSPGGPAGDQRRRDRRWRPASPTRRRRRPSSPRSASSPSQAEEWLAKEGLESRTLFRVAPTVPEGLLETVLGEDATLLVTEWRTALRERRRQRGLRGAGPLAGAGPDRARRRLALRPAAASSPRPDAGRAPVEPRTWRWRRSWRRAARRTATASRPWRRRRSGAGAASPPSRRSDWIEAADPVGWIAQNLQEGDLPLFVGHRRRPRGACGKVPALDRRALPGGAGRGAERAQRAPRAGHRPRGRRAQPQAHARLTMIRNTDNEQPTSEVSHACSRDVPEGEEDPRRRSPGSHARARPIRSGCACWRSACAGPTTRSRASSTARRPPASRTW